MEAAGVKEQLLANLRSYWAGDNAHDGQQLAAAIRQSQLSHDEARDVIRQAILSSAQHADAIAAACMSLEIGAQVVASRLVEEPTRTFYRLFITGPLCLRSLVLGVLLNAKAWESPEKQTQAERDVLTLLLAKLLEPGVDKPEIALFGIARLIAADWTKLAKQVDSDAFYEFFGYLDADESDAVRSQATLVIAKVYELDPKRTEHELLSFVQKMVGTRRVEHFALACSVVGTIFPVMTKIAAGIVLQENFIETLVTLASSKKDEKLRTCTLELFSSACVDGACRKALREKVDDWAWRIVDDHKHVPGSKEGAAAAVLVAKLRAEQTEEGSGSVSDEDLVDRLKGMAMDERTFSAAVEALSYQATQPLVKKALADDSALLERIVKHIAEHESNQVTVYTVFQLFNSLTVYAPPLSEEQKKLLQVKAFSDGSKPPSIHPLDEDGPVSDRNKKLLAAGVSSAIIKAIKSASAALLDAIARLLASLSKHPHHRGPMAQQGLLDVALGIANLPQDIGRAKRNAALTVARILVPIDPALLFQNRPVDRAIAPLAALLSPTPVDGDTLIDERWWRGFPVLTALQALANLATLPSPAPDLVVAKAWPAIEDAWQSDTPALRAAATELLLNLTQSAPGLAKFDTATAAADPRATHRWRILTAYFGDEDIRLRLAAGGALAGLVADGAGARAFADMPHGLAYLKEAMLDPDEGVRMRAVVVLAGLAAAVGADAEVKQAVQREGLRAAAAEMKRARKVPEAVAAQFAVAEEALGAV